MEVLISEKLPILQKKHVHVMIKDKEISKAVEILIVLDHIFLSFKKKDEHEL